MTDEAIAPAEVPAQEPPRLHGNRSKIIPLDYPVEYGGKVYEAITVRRMTGSEVSDFFAQSADDRRLPMFDAPREVIDALDADDAAAVSEAVLDFLPRSMRTASE